MNAGFVYLLANRSMPDIFKIGCTERSPAQRARELSGATGVPMPFDVVCFVECENFQSHERKLHTIFADSRVSNSREFFQHPLDEMIAALQFHDPDSVHAFCLTKIGEWYLTQERNRGPH